MDFARYKGEAEKGLLADEEGEGEEESGGRKRKGKVKHHVIIQTCLYR